MTQVTFEALLADHRRLSDLRVRAEADQEASNRRLNELKAEAEAAFGTGNPKELKAMFEQRDASNAAAKEKFEAEIARINAALVAIDAGVQA